VRSTSPRARSRSILRPSPFFEVDTVASSRRGCASAFLAGSLLGALDAASRAAGAWRCMRDVIDASKRVCPFLQKIDRVALALGEIATAHWRR